MKHTVCDCETRALVLMAVLSVFLLPLHAESEHGDLSQTSSQGVSAATSATVSTSETRFDDVPVGPGDLLQVRIFGTKDFDQELRVSNSGEISVPLVGTLHVAGLSPVQTAQLITDKLVEGNYYKHPQVSVLVKEYATEGVYVLGEVQKPGSYSILVARDVLQAISLAGGTTPKAGRTVRITNPSRPQPLTVNLNISQSGEAGLAAADDVKLLPGDTLLVSKAGIVYVVGDVHMPSGIVIDNPNLTVVQAIALAQGTNPTASLDRTRLIRRTPNGPKEMPIALKKMLAAEIPDMPVQADDVIFVPTSKAKAASRRSLEAILQAATGVAIYGRY